MLPDPDPVAAGSRVLHGLYNPVQALLYMVWKIYNKTNETQKKQLSTQVILNLIVPFKVCICENILTHIKSKE